jgi:hypothetical protein
MSIQAGWNNMLGHLAVARGIRKFSKDVSSIKDQLKGYENISARFSNQTPEERTAAFQNLETENPDLFRRVNDMMNTGSGSAPATPVAPAGQAMMEQEIATQQAQEAAAIADMAPQNHGYMDNIEQQVESALAADTDPMAELSRLTNSAMDEMNRQVADQIHRIETGGNN